jgi:hypothetical protein
MEALAAPAIMAVVQALFGDDATMHGIAAFAINPEYNYCGPWHRDSYFAWGKDSAFERQIREMKTLPATQILLALEDDEGPQRLIPSTATGVWTRHRDDCRLA